MIKLWQGLLFLSILPAGTAVLFWKLSLEYPLVEKTIISVGACGIGFFVFLLTIGSAVIMGGGTHDDGSSKRGPLITGWVISGVLALIFAALVHRIHLWGWLIMGFFWIGCFMPGLGVSFLIWALLDLVFLKKK